MRDEHLPRQRILSLWIADLPCDRILRRLRVNSTPSARQVEPPLVVLDKIRNARRIVSLNETARACGLRLGETEADARARIPHLLCEDAEPDKDAALLRTLADWCARYTPLVALDGKDGLFLDITGCAHLFGGEDALLKDVLMRLDRQGFCVAGAIAGTVGAAWGMARFGSGGVLKDGGEREALASLPLAALRISPEAVSGLNQVGLKTIGQLYERPRAPLTNRFGPELILRLDQTFGAQGEAISPRFEAPLISAERRFFDPISRVDDVKAVALSLAGQVSKALERRVEGGRMFELTLFRVDGAVQKFKVGTSSPLRAPKRILRLFAEKLKADESVVDAGFGFDLVRLDVLMADKAPAVQDTLNAAGTAETGASLEDLVDRLGARLGLERITRLLPIDRHIPESQTGFVPAALAHEEALAWSGFLGGAAAAVLRREQTAVSPQFTFAEDSTQTYDTENTRWHTGLMTRPLRLIDPAEEVEALAMVPDGPPLRFRWRRGLYQVARSEGPERIAPPWWIGAADRPSEAKEGVTRDYFRIEDTDGRRFWLYREGLYERETARPRWYLQGLFA
ncbi:DNA polymerase Y family protein [Roseibium sp.]|uniref:Y-family DNA polymerase n=1 Tax=Roseibium sp. TaxID=1936156 RepID=UPI003B52B73C